MRMHGFLLCSSILHSYSSICTNNSYYANKLSNKLISITPAEYLAGKAKDYRVIDAGLAPSIRGAKYVDLAKVNAPIEGISKDEKLLLVCAKGKRAYFLQNRLRHLGYTNTLSLEGGLFFNDVKVKLHLN